MAEEQTPHVGIIVVAHADYGSAMLRTAEFILGSLSDCSSISVDVAQEVPETVRRLNDAADRLDKGAGVIVLTDMFGGTPTNLALSLLGSHHVEVVTGVNLPMLLKVFSCRESRSKSWRVWPARPERAGLLSRAACCAARKTIKMKRAARK